MENTIKNELKDEAAELVNGGAPLKFIGGVNDTNTEVDREIIGVLPHTPVIPIGPDTEPVEKNGLK